LRWRTQIGAIYVTIRRLSGPLSRCRTSSTKSCAAKRFGPGSALPRWFVFVSRRPQKLEGNAKPPPIPCWKSPASAAVPWYRRTSTTS